MPTTPEELKRILEAALLCAVQPMTVGDFRKMFEEDVSSDTIRVLLDQLRVEWSEAGKAAELVQLASGWRLRTRPEFMPYIERLNPEKPPKYSRAVLETLAIIAYRQPVTWGSMEDIWGAPVAATVIKMVEERGWIDVVGNRETPGRPALFATTKKFLDDLGLRGLNELPVLDTVDMPMLDLPAAPMTLLGHGQGGAEGAASNARTLALVEALPFAGADALEQIEGELVATVKMPIEGETITQAELDPGVPEPSSPEPAADESRQAQLAEVTNLAEPLLASDGLNTSDWPFAPDFDDDKLNSNVTPTDDPDAAEGKED